MLKTPTTIIFQSLFFITLVLTPCFAAAQKIDIEILIFKHKNTTNNLQQDFNSKRVKQLNQNINQKIRLNTQRFKGGQLLRLANTRDKLRNAGYEILFTQLLRTDNLSPEQPTNVILENQNESINGIIEIVKNNIINTNFLLRYRPAGSIATNTDPAYFIEQQLRMSAGNIYYMDNSQFGVIAGIWQN